jgi:anti-sigma B factor antagonist
MHSPADKRSAISGTGNWKPETAFVYCGAPMRLSAIIRRQNDTAVVDCSGRLVGSAEADQFREKVKRLFSQTVDVVLDLSGVDYIDSEGLGILVGLLISSRTAGRALQIAGMTKRVRELFELTRLNTVFPLVKATPDGAKAKAQVKGSS